LKTWSVRFEARGERRERLIAELWSLGTLGLEETDEAVVAYFAGEGIPRELPDRAAALGVVAGPAELVPDRDWEREWRRGLEPRQIAGLWIRPSWCASQGRPELVIDPRQAFGSGEHATTRLTLALLLERLQPGDTVLDAGTGSGILLLAAQRCGAHGVGFDIDAASISNARDNALANGLPGPFYYGSAEALWPGARFDLVVANLLISRLEPLLPALRRSTRRELVLSGYLLEERARLARAMAGWSCLEEREEPQSGDIWYASRWHHTRARQSSSSASSVSSNS